MRKSKVARETKETKIYLSLNLDEQEEVRIDTGIGFFDHMLNLFASHGRFGMDLSAEGDYEVDNHHVIEDIGIVLGKAFKEALGDKNGIRRYASTFTPMDESLSRVCIDISGRGMLVFDSCFTCERIGSMETEMIEEFFRAFAVSSGITLHVAMMYGKNNHHMAEAMFKGFGRVLKEAVSIDKLIEGIPSTKGVL
jgi:imidazoleglycerol-phosphate dehydratase